MFTLTPLHRVHTLLSLLITGTSLLLSLPRLHAQAHSTFQRVNSQFPDIDLRETLRPSALKDIRNGGVSITGKVRDLSLNEITLRVTNSLGKTYLTHTVVHSEAFRVVYPKDFPSAPPITPCVLFVDALPSRSLTPDSSKRSAEITLVAYDSRKQRIPDYPTAFMTDLRDRNGKLDANSTKWRIMQPLINLYMRSYGAQLAGVGKPDFDINLPTDFATFKSSLALYDFDGRDKDWLSAQKNRPKRTFWKSVWSNWFNSSNDHPLDGNPANQNPANYMPYAFTNDFADLLITHLLRFRLTTPSEDNLSTICSEALENLLAWQNREPANFALLDKSGHQENYTAGAFRYGLFVNGDFMTEGNGWFYNPAFHDYAGGGVLNGRAVWALGEGLRAEPVGTLAKKGERGTDFGFAVLPERWIHRRIYKANAAGKYLLARCGGTRIPDIGYTKCLRCHAKQNSPQTYGDASPNVTRGMHSISQRPHRPTKARGAVGGLSQCRQHGYHRTGGGRKHIAKPP